MPFAAPLDLLADVARRGAALGCVSVYNLETMQAVSEAAAGLELPVMLSVGNEAAAHAGLETLGRCAMAAARGAPQPATVHLNHGRSIEVVAQALELGFPSVMFDGSHLPFEENLARTREAVELARDAGACIEGELGPLSGAIHGGDGADAQELAGRFVAETGVDILAVSVPAAENGGIADLAPLAGLCRQLPCFVALHGASRLGPQGPALARAAGVSKVNFHSEIKKAMALAIGQGGADPLAALQAMRLAVRQTVQGRLALLQPGA